MDGYNAVLRLHKERPDYIPIVKKCLDEQHKQEQKQYWLGFEWNDVEILPIKLVLLSTEYGILQVSYKSNSATHYRIKDVAGVQQALKDIEAKKVASPCEQNMSLKVWLSSDTMQRFKAYLAKECADGWDAENVVMERALNLFLDQVEHKVA